MFEYPDVLTIVSQMKEVLIGKKVKSGTLIKKNQNMFMSQKDAERYSHAIEGVVTDIECLPPDIFIMLNNGYGIMICQSGGKILYNKTLKDKPKSHNICFDFYDGSSLTYTMRLFTLGIYVISHDEWNNRKKAMNKFNPMNSYDDFISFINSNENENKTPIKIFLATKVMGIMSTLAAEILLYAGIYPSFQLKKLDKEDYKRIYSSMHNVLNTAYKKGGKTSEFDLYNKNGQYKAAAERKNIGTTCPCCNTILCKSSIGGVTAYCPNCQKK